VDSTLQALLNQSVTWATFTGRDGYGKPTYNTAGATILPAYVSRKLRMISNAAGKVIVTRAMVLLDGIPGIGLEDQLTLPDGSTPVLVLVQTGVDEYGASFLTRVYTE
jgi:hypothetical protein